MIGRLSAMEYINSAYVKNQLSEGPGKKVVVYFDINFGDESMGRVVMELYNHVVPITAENFRRLCVGLDLGSSAPMRFLTYRGSRFHKVLPKFICQGGDIIANDGTNGMSIYGKTFEDENFSLPAKAGAIIMANYGRKDTNNSQFGIVTVESKHLEQTNVVVGYVLRGFGIIKDMEKYASDDGKPLIDIYVKTCGEVDPRGDWGYFDSDITSDRLPPYPIDWYENQTLTEELKLEVLTSIKNAGVQFHDMGQQVPACRKFRKTDRYYRFFRDMNPEQKHESVEQVYTESLFYMGRSFMKVDQHAQAIPALSESFKRSGDPDTLLELGNAHMGVEDFEQAVDDFKQAYHIDPRPEYLAEFNEAKSKLLNFRKTQQVMFKNMFR